MRTPCDGSAGGTGGASACAWPLGLAWLDVDPPTVGRETGALLLVPEVGAAGVFTCTKECSGARIRLSELKNCLSTWLERTLNRSLICCAESVVFICCSLFPGYG